LRPTLRPRGAPRPPEHPAGGAADPGVHTGTEGSGWHAGPASSGSSRLRRGSEEDGISHVIPLSFLCLYLVLSMRPFIPWYPAGSVDNINPAGPKDTLAETLSRSFWQELPASLQNSLGLDIQKSFRTAQQELVDCGNFDGNVKVNFHVKLTTEELQAD